MELSEHEIKDIIKKIEDECYDDDYDTTWDGRVTYIRVNEDSDGCSAYYGFDEDGPRHSVAQAYENHTLKVGDYVIKFTNHGNRYIDDLSITKEHEYSLSDEELQDALENAILEIVSEDVELPFDGYEQFENDWTEEEIIEEIESQLESCNYIEVDGKIYPADNWQDIVDFLFDGEEPDEDSYTKMDSNDVAKVLAANIDCY